MKAAPAFLILAAAAVFAFAAAASPFEAGVGAMSFMPGGGIDRQGGAALRISGSYALDEDLSVEGDFAWLGKSAVAGAGALWHWQGSEIYSDYFGFSRFDPFFTAGARWFFGDGDPLIGPKAGFGAFYHISEAWSLRFDAEATLALDGDCGAVYGVGAGIVRLF